jgi:hypothetical protein
MAPETLPRPQYCMVGQEKEAEVEALEDETGQIEFVVARVGDVPLPKTRSTPLDPGDHLRRGHGHEYLPLPIDDCRVGSVELRIGPPRPWGKSGFDVSVVHAVTLVRRARMTAHVRVDRIRPPQPKM